MNTQTSYVNKKAQQTLLAVLLTMLVSVFIPQYTNAQTYSGPIVITKGGTYKGNWESKNSEVAAVDVKTSEPVIIENSNIRGAGALVRSVGHGANITIRNTNGYGITPTPWSNFKKPRRFLSLDVFKNAVVENCYMENTAGIYVGGKYSGNNTTANTVKIRYNKAKNIDGRVYGGKELVQFVQFNFKGAIKNVEVAWNQVINEPNNSAVEDNINIFNTQGTSDSPIRIHNNFIKGAYPIPANSSKYTGGGIISDTNGDLSTATRHIKAYENHLVNMGNYSMGIAGGNNIRYHNNRAINSARFSDGSKFNMFTSGLWSNDYYKKGTTFSNTIDHNEVGVTSWGYPNDRKDFNPNNQYAKYLNNVNLPGPITVQTENDEYTRWQQKLSRNGVTLGPKGSSTGGSTPPPAATAPAANQAPTVSITGPADKAVFEEGKTIALTVKATDTDGKVVKVEYFRGTTKIGESTASPFSYNWTNAAVGSHSITAKATDDKGATKTTAPVSISVKASTATSAPAAQPKATVTAATAYPSTFSDIITLDMGNQSVKLTKVFIADHTGKTIHSVAKPDLSNNQLEIDLTGVRMISGMYYIKYTDSTGKSHSIKIFKG